MSDRQIAVATVLLLAFFCVAVVAAIVIRIVRFGWDLR